MPKLLWTIVPVLFLAAGPALAEVTRRDAIEAQTASALASADYAERHCPSLRIGRQRRESRR